MMGRTAGDDEGLVQDFDQDYSVADKRVGVSVEFSMERCELDRFGLKGAVCEEILCLRMRHYFIGLVRSPASSFCGTCLNEYFVRDASRSNTQIMS